MHILVTGASGFIGSVLALKLADMGHTIVPITRSSQRDVDSRFIKNHLVLDLLEPIESEMVPRLDVILHTAARHPNSRGFLLSQLGENQIMARNLATLVRATSPRLLINLSTISVHGFVEHRTVNERSSFNNPLEYGASKLEAESILAHCSDITKVINLRLPAVLGRNAPKHLLANLVDKALSNADISIYNPESLYNNVLLLDDLVPFLIKLIDSSTSSGPPSVAFPLASEAPVAFRQIVSKVLDVTNSRSELTYGDFNHPSFYIDDGFARRNFGYKSRSVLEAVELFASERQSLSKA